jgi:hypothetical protein
MKTAARRNRRPWGIRGRHGRRRVRRNANVATGKKLLLAA